MSASRHASEENEWYEHITRSSRRITAAGALLVGAVVLGFGLWAGTAPLAGAVVTGGAFVAGGENKVLQHPDGGVIRELAVREGDAVTEGQVLVTLDDTGPRTERRRLALREVRLEATRIRLQAETSDTDDFDWPPEFGGLKGDPEMAAILMSQVRTFRARRASMNSEVRALWESIKALEERSQASSVQMLNLEHQIGLYTEEITTKAQLVSQGLSRKSEVYALQRGFAASSGEMGRLRGEAGEVRDRIARTREQIDGIRFNAVKAASELLLETLAELHDVRERTLAAEAVLKRIRVTAPVRGIVVKMRYHTAGGVIEPGRSILEILPVEEKLVIEARLRPQDIDHVHVQQTAVIRLTALHSRSTPLLSGVVTYVSADAVSDRGSVNANLDGNTRDVYMVRVQIDSEELARLPKFRAIAGMPVEVFISTGERTFFEYLSKPLFDSFHRAFREN